MHAIHVPAAGCERDSFNKRTHLFHGNVHRLLCNLRGCSAISVPVQTNLGNSTMAARDAGYCILFAHQSVIPFLFFLCVEIFKAEKNETTVACCRLSTIKCQHCKAEAGVMRPICHRLKWFSFFLKLSPI